MYRRLLFAWVLLAWPVAAMAGSQETLDQLKQRAAAARDEERSKLFLEVAQRQLKTAEKAYGDGSIDEGKAAVGEVADYCEKAAAAATSSRKHLKRTEIKIRDLAHKLTGMQRSVSFENRESLQAAIDRIEKARGDLLTAMFGLKS